VRSHLVADVPIGLFLSAGLDSAALAILAGAVREGDLDAFTVAFEGDRGLDESEVAARTAQLAGVRHHLIRMNQGQVLPLVERWLQSGDQPSVDGLNTYLISEAVRAHGMKVALSGLGGDELFGGYSTFRDVPRLAAVARWARWVPREARRRLTRWALWRRTAPQRQKGEEMAGTPPDLVSQYLRRRRLLSDLELQELGLEAGALQLDPTYLPPEADPRGSLVEEDDRASVRILECKLYMGNMLLRDTDVCSMAHGLEIRVPLLDRRVLDLMLPVPGEVLLPAGQAPKARLLEALRGRIPAEVARAPKRGFSLPYARWMAGPLRPLVESLIERLASSGWVDPAAVRRVWKAFLDEPQGPAWTRAWILAVMGRWSETLRGEGRA
jgi:asparagine synthase (glutamine-hydrolysing)